MILHNHYLYIYIYIYNDSYKRQTIYIYIYIYIYIFQEEAHERKKNRYETLCADCVEKGWICHMNPIGVGCRGFLGNLVISFLSKKRNPWPQFESYLKSSSDYGAISIKFARKREVFSMNEMHAEPPFLCDCVTSRNGYRKRVITSTAESKRVFFLNHKLHTKNKDERPM